MQHCSAFSAAPLFSVTASSNGIRWERAWSTVLIKIKCIYFLVYSVHGFWNIAWPIFKLNKKAESSSGGLNCHYLKFSPVINDRNWDAFAINRTKHIKTKQKHLGLQTSFLPRATALSTLWAGNRWSKNIEVNDAMLPSHYFMVKDRGNWKLMRSQTGMCQGNWSVAPWLLFFFQAFQVIGATVYEVMHFSFWFSMCARTRGCCSWKALGDIVDFAGQHCAGKFSSRILQNFVWQSWQ